MTEKSEKINHVPAKHKGRHYNLQSKKYKPEVPAGFPRAIY